LRLWARSDADPETDHPLDRHDQLPGAGLITFDVAALPFEPWDEFRTNIRDAGENPLYVTDAVDTYYHDWQVLLAADALEMGIRLIFDTRRRDLMDIALRGSIRDLPENVALVEVSLQGSGGLKQGLLWSPFLDAAARVEVVRLRKLNALSREHHHEPFALRGAELDDFNAMLKRTAERAISAIGATRPQKIAFLAYLSKRWDQWTRRGRQEVAAEYHRYILLAASMVMHADD
jgi:hypothetical protein